MFKSIYNLFPQRKLLKKTLKALIKKPLPGLDNAKDFKLN